jgi:hypothetical protein
MSNDSEHLRILGIFYFVVAGFAALFALFPLLHFAFGIAMIAGAFPDASGEDIETFMGWFFVLFSGIWILCGLTFAICLALAGKYLMQRRHYIYCLVMAAVACAFAPFGTVLGVFTIVILMKDSVKELFGREVAT